MCVCVNVCIQKHMCVRLGVCVCEVWASVCVCACVWIYMCVLVGGAGGSCEPQCGRCVGA